MKNQEIYCDGKYVWLYLPSNNELIINHYNPEEGKGFEQVFSLFNLEGVKVRYDGQKIIEGRSLDQIYLAISNPEVAYNNATFWINQTSKFLEKVVIIDENQTTITYAFSNFKTDQGLSDSTFVFDITNFDGAIIDLR